MDSNWENFDCVGFVMLSKIWQNFPNCQCFRSKRFNHLKFKSPQGRYLLLKNMHVRYRKDSKIFWSSLMSFPFVLAQPYPGSDGVRFRTPTIFFQLGMCWSRGAEKIDEFFWSTPIANLRFAATRGSGVVRNTQEIITGSLEWFSTARVLDTKLYQNYHVLVCYFMYTWILKKDMIPDLSHIFSTITVFVVEGPFAKRWFYWIFVSPTLSEGCGCPFLFSERGQVIKRWHGGSNGLAGLRNHLMSWFFNKNRSSKLFSGVVLWFMISIWHD